MKQYVLYDKTYRAFIKAFSMDDTEINVDHTRSYYDALSFLQIESQKIVKLMDVIETMTGHEVSIWQVPWDSEVKLESVVKDETHRPSVADKR